MRFFEQWVGVWCSMDELGFVCIFFYGYMMISAGFIVYAAVNNLFFIIQTILLIDTTYRDEKCQNQK